MDIPNRDLSLKTPEANKLLNSLPPNIQGKFIHYFLNQPKSPSSDLLDYFRENSSIFKVGQKDPTSALIFEYLYTRDVIEPIDEYFIECKAGKQIYHRLIALEKNLSFWIKAQLNGNQTISVDNISPGTGRDMIRVLNCNPELREKVLVRNIDPDTHTLEISQRLIEEHNLKSSFSLVPDKFFDAPFANASIVLLIGIICPFTIGVSKKVLNKISQFCVSGGIIIFSAALRKMVENDPLTDCIMRLAGMGLTYKSEAECENLIKSLRWEMIGKFYDEPLHHHGMFISRVP